MQAPERLVGNDWMRPAAPYQIFRTSQAEPYPLHWHDFYELALVISGTGRHVVNGAERELGRGDLFLLTPVDFHSLRPRPNETLELYNFIFTDQMLDAELSQWLFRGVTPLLLTFDEMTCASLEAEFNRIWEEANSSRLGGQRIIRNAFERIVIELARHTTAQEPEATAAQTPGLRKAVLYLHHQFRHSLTLKDVAQQAGLAPNYFSERFRQMTGIPFQNYLQGLRLNFAASLLAVSDLPVTEICMASGFSTMSHFERAFKQKYGHSPTAHRQRAATNGHT